MFNTPLRPTITLLSSFSLAGDNLLGHHGSDVRGERRVLPDGGAALEPTPAPPDPEMRRRSAHAAQPRNHSNTCDAKSKAETEHVQSSHPQTHPISQASVRWQVECLVGRGGGKQKCGLRFFWWLRVRPLPPLARRSEMYRL